MHVIIISDILFDYGMNKINGREEENDMRNRSVIEKEGKSLETAH